MDQIKFKKIDTAIVFFMLVNQFRRITGKIEELHDRSTYADCNIEERDKSLLYYQEEKARLLAMMKDCLDDTEKYYKGPF